MRAVLRLPAFRLLFAGLAASMVGDALLMLVYAIWVKSLTGSSGMLIAAACLWPARRLTGPHAPVGPSAGSRR